MLTNSECDTASYTFRCEYRIIMGYYIGHSKSSRPKSVFQMRVKIGYFQFVHCIP